MDLVNLLIKVNIMNDQLIMNYIYTYIIYAYQNFVRKNI